MATTTATTLPDRARYTKFSIRKLPNPVASTVDLSQKKTCFFGRKHYSQPSPRFVHAPATVARPFFINNSRMMAWSIQSSVNASGFDPSSSNSGSGSGNGNGNGRPRLIRAIQAVQSRVGLRIRELRKNLPMKVFFFLIGFYCATAFATVIGQTGDWDILSAAFAVAVVEAIGALMYNGTLSVLTNVRSLITMFNYWKAGLSLGLFLDSFKYEVDKITGFSNPFSFEIDLFSVFL